MARSIWSGTISFGLISLPVKLFRPSRRLLERDTPTTRITEASSGEMPTTLDLLVDSFERVREGDLAPVRSGEAGVGTDIGLSRGEEFGGPRSRSCSSPTTSCSWLRLVAASG